LSKSEKSARPAEILCYRFPRILAATSSIRPLAYLYEGHRVRTPSPVFLGII